MTDASAISAAVAAELATEFPGADVYESKRSAAKGPPPHGGWVPGYKVPCFVVSIDDPEPIDELGCFEDVSVGYFVLVEYIKVAQAKVTATPPAGPQTVVIDEDIKEKRARIRQRLYKPRLGAIPNVMDIRMSSREPHLVLGDKTMVCSGQLFLYTLSETRPE